MASPVQETPILPNTPVARDLGETPVDLSTAASSPAGSWLERNQKLILGVVGGALAIAVGIFLYRTFVQAPQQAAATEQMWRAQQQFERDSFQLALFNPAPGYLGFVDIADQYGSTPAGNLANYYAGVSYLQLGQYDAAIDYLDDFDADGTILPATKAGTLGDAYAQKGDLAAAADYYEDAVDEADDNGLLAPYYLMKLGLLREREGDAAAANALYARIADEFPDSQEGQNIEKYLLRTGN